MKPTMTFSPLRTLLLVAALGAAAPTQAADFAGAGGAIPDASTVGLDIPFSVSGIVGAVGEVRVSLTLNHTYTGDLRATLISPGGTARLVLFARAGSRRTTASGVSANLAGTYVFSDAASGNLWTSMAGLNTDQTIPPGSYRTSTAGNPARSSVGGCSTRLALAFGGLSGAQVNGTWTLNVADVVGSDTGSVGSALLSIDTSPAIFRSGFEEIPTPSQPGFSAACTKPLFDFTGTGLSSYTVVRNTGGGPGGAMTWFVKDNNGTISGAESSFLHGIATDEFIDGDFDGDGISDATVWRASTGTFMVRRSSRPGDAILNIPLGAIGDDPTHVGDYDGDGVSDAAVYRSGASAGDPSLTLIRLSSTGTVRTLTTGENGSFAIGGVDYDGDARADMAIQSNMGGIGRFRLYSGISGDIVDDFTFGTPTDVVVTGSHVGSLVADITTIRGVAGVLNWSTRDGETGVGQPVVAFGVSATDSVQGGDFDGDGVSDQAVWRPSATPGMSKFIVRRSLDPVVPVEIPFGQNGDYPVANARVH